MSQSFPKKVLMTTDAVGGVWTYSAGLASALAATGMEIHLATLGPPPRQHKRAMLRDSRVHLIESNLALEWQDAGGDDVPNARRFLEDIEDAIRPDIVHLNSFREALLRELLGSRLQRYTMAVGAEMAALHTRRCRRT
jgi:hypothetical protein